MDKVKSFSYLLASIALCIFAYSYSVRSDAYAQRQAAAAFEDKHDYQLVQLGQMRRDQFIIDRKTGRIWENACLSPAKNGIDCNAAVWDEMSVIGLNFTREDLMKYVAAINSNNEKSKKETDK